MDVDARIEGLQAQIERLDARVDQLERALGMDFLVPIEWRLTGSEGRVFGVLMARELATKDAIMAALYRDTLRDEPELKIVDVFICKMRAKLKPFGIVIETLWGNGYFLKTETKAVVRDRLALGMMA